MNKPSLEEIHEYCQQRHPSVDPVAFFLHYETNGWMVGKVPMKNWRAGVANWDRMQQTRNRGNGHANTQLPETFAERDSRSVVEAAERIRARLASAGGNVNAGRQTLFGSEDAATPRRPKQLPSGRD